MASGIGTVEIKQSRGKLIVNGLGKTNTGQKYIKGSEALEATSMADPKFKAELEAAVAKLMP